MQQQVQKDGNEARKKKQQKQILSGQNGLYPMEGCNRDAFSFFFFFFISFQDPGWNLQKADRNE